MEDNWSPEEYERLAAGVVEQAVTDYRRALRRLWNHRTMKWRCVGKRSANSSSGGIWDYIPTWTGK